MIDNQTSMTYEQAQALFAAQSLPLTQSLYHQLQYYLKMLVETNQYMNLTAIVSPPEVWTKHFLDSAVVLRHLSLPLGASVIDVGTGAGFPGMVLGILRPDLHMVLLDSLQKRVQFLEEVKTLMGLANVACIHARAEQAGQSDQYREQFDLAIARAVAALPVLTEYCLPFVKVGGRFAAMKGPSETAADAEQVAQTLGGILAGEIAYSLADAGQRKLILVEKTGHTQKQYPRRGDKIRKHPLV